MVRLFPANLSVPSSRPASPNATGSMMIYRQVKSNGTTQVGILGVVDAQDHTKGIIRPHEQVITKPVVNRSMVLPLSQSCTDPIMLMYRENRTVSSIVERIMRTNEPYETPHQGESHCVRDTLWLVQDARDICALQEAFEDVARLYIADGHHRMAAACRPDHGGGSAPARQLTAFIFPDTHLSVLSYHRCVGRLPQGMSAEDVLSQLWEDFEVGESDPRCVCDPDWPVEAPPSPVTVARRSSSGGEDPRTYAWAHRASPTMPATPAVPSEQSLLLMFISGSWYSLRPRSLVRTGNQGHVTPLQSIGCQILLDRVLKPIFGLAETSSSDNFLIYVDGREGAEGVEARVRCGEAAVGFLVAPVPPAEVMRVADAGQLLPAKATYFDPKPTPGLLAQLQW